MPIRATLAAAVIAGALTLGAAAQTLVMPRSRVLPAARAQATLGTDQNGNTKVDLKVRHMAAPDALTPPRRFYVVWVRVAGHPIERKGLLRIQSGLDGEVKFLTPHTHFDLLVTAEDTRTPHAPSREVVLEGALARAR